MSLNARFRRDNLPIGIGVEQDLGLERVDIVRRRLLCADTGNSGECDKERGRSEHGECQVVSRLSRGMRNLAGKKSVFKAAGSAELEGMAVVAANERG